MSNPSRHYSGFRARDRMRAAEDAELADRANHEKLTPAEHDVRLEEAREMIVAAGNLLRVAQATLGLYCTSDASSRMDLSEVARRTDRIAAELKKWTARVTRSTWS